MAFIQRSLKGFLVLVKDLGPLLFNVLINGLWNSIKHSRFFLIADDIQIFRIVNSTTDYTLLQSDIVSIRGWCAANCMKRKTDKTEVIAFTRKINAVNYS
jgi:hypothetical protein